MSDMCIYCTQKISILSSFRGAGDGLGQQFAHDDCWMRGEIKKLEYKNISLREQNEAFREGLEKIILKYPDGFQYAYLPEGCRGIAKGLLSKYPRAVK